MPRIRLYIFAREWKDETTSICIVDIGDNLIAIWAPSMDTRNLEELRALAKKLGLTGYSKLRKQELLRRLAAEQRAPHAKPARRAAKTPGDAGKKKLRKQAAATSTAPRKSSRRKPPAASTAVPTAPPTTALTDAEQRIESAKYAFAPPGVTLREPAYGAGFEEDIDKLPEISTPMLCILPQKPGVLLGYWVLPPGRALPYQTLKLRLAQLTGTGIGVLQEVSLPGPHGYWYFHVGEALDVGAIYLQLGYYAPDGHFINAIERGVARVPSLYASSHTDRRWWVSEESFRVMYQRAGGSLRGTHLGWAGPGSSPGGAQAGQLAWRGNVSSR